MSDNTNYPYRIEHQELEPAEVPAEVPAAAPVAAPVAAAAEAPAPVPVADLNAAPLGEPAQFDAPAPIFEPAQYDAPAPAAAPVYADTSHTNAGGYQTPPPPPQQPYGYAPPQPQQQPQYSYQAPSAKTRSGGIGSASKDKWVAAVLAFVLGSLGIHKFYLGYKTEGMIMLLVAIIGSICLGLGFAVMYVIGLIEAVKYVTLTQEDFEAAYVHNYKGWL